MRSASSAQGFGLSLTKDSLALAIEALSWMAYTGIGERSALLKASKQLGLNNLNDLRQAHGLIMETTRFQNRVDWLISKSVPEEKTKRTSHGIRSLLKIIAYTKYVDEICPSVGNYCGLG